jgi:uncharacterized OB-fold protein
MPEQVARVLPPSNGVSGFFWTSGKDGRLRLLRCESCAYLIHPPTGYCPKCQARDVLPAEVSGRGTVYSFTINFQPWDGAGDVYAIGLIEIEEQSDIRLVTNIVDIDPAEIRIGMPVQVVFENHDPIYLPLFRPVAS